VNSLGMRDDVLVTGGCGFIGAVLIERVLASFPDVRIINLDALTYAARKNFSPAAATSGNYAFVHGDVADAACVNDVFTRFSPRMVFHLAAQTHVDRSLKDPALFVRSNVLGTQVMLEASTRHCAGLEPAARDRFRFLHVSTDEVFGSADPGVRFDEESRYAPSSPYSASKAAGDHLVNAWGTSYQLPIILTHCTNNYGVGQYPEKLIPLMLERALREEPLPIYGDGLQVRDWLHVEDHVAALMTLMQHAPVGSRWCISAEDERSNLDVVHTLCVMLDALAPRKSGTPYAQLITHVTDRAGHDRRYSLNSRRLRETFGWTPQVGFADGLKRMVEHGVANAARK
jgi:dTDP-glucose 4,6-dehydratase